MNKKEQAIKEFEQMRNKAELTALSKVSLERELTDGEYTRMKALYKELEQ